MYGCFCPLFMRNSYRNIRTTEKWYSRVGRVEGGSMTFFTAFCVINSWNSTRTNLFLLQVFWKRKYQVNNRVVILRTVDLTMWNHQTIGTCLRKGLCISMTDCEGTTTGLETEMTWTLHEVVWKMRNLIPRQCEMKTIIEEPSSTGYLNKVIHSLFTCYFVNTPPHA